MRVRCARVHNNHFQTVSSIQKQTHKHIQTCSLDNWHTAVLHERPRCSRAGVIALGAQSKAKLYTITFLEEMKWRVTRPAKKMYANGNCCLTISPKQVNVQIAGPDAVVVQFITFEVVHPHTFNTLSNKYTNAHLKLLENCTSAN